jgi:Zn-dependent protease with chaperone function
MGRRRETLTHYFPFVVYATLSGLVVLLLAQGVLLWWAVYDFGAAVDGAPLWILLVLGAGLVFAAILIVTGWREFLAVEPINVSGVVVDPNRLPQLCQRIGGLAGRLGTPPPTRLILGLEPTVFVTLAPINLRGSGILPATETIYLPLTALRLLSDMELDAVLAHELGHFRGTDLQFSRRFVPVFRSLTISLTNVSIQDDDEYVLLRLARLPAVSALAGMLHMMQRSVVRIGRQRELEADRVATEIIPADALVSALTKLLVASVQWPVFHRNSTALVHSGEARRNLVDDFVLRTQHLLALADRPMLIAALLSKRLSHPLDTHPTLAERASALGVEAAPVIERSIAELMEAVPGSATFRPLEEELTAAAIEHVRLPGVALTVSASTPLPAPLDISGSVSP